MQHIGSVLENAFGEIGYDNPLEYSDILKTWRNVVGEYIERQTQVERVQERSLVVRVSSHNWIAELNSMKGMIMERLNKRLTKKKIKEIHFIQGEIAPPEIPLHKESHERVPDEELNEMDIAKIEKALGPVKDPEIREILSRMMYRDAVVRNRAEQHHEEAS